MTSLDRFQILSASGTDGDFSLAENGVLTFAESSENENDLVCTIEVDLVEVSDGICAL